MNKKPFIVLKNIRKQYESNSVIIEDLDLKIDKGTFVTILGPSGCGKSTLLKMIGGFEQPTSGKILLDGMDIKDMAIHHRPITTVFQDYALFPTMNVFKNIQYGLCQSRVPMENVSPIIYERLNKVLANAQIKAKQKQEKNNNKKNKLLVKLKEEKAKLAKIDLKTWAYKFKKMNVQSLENELNDLDYWQSYWDTYVLLEKEKFEKRFTKRKYTKEEMHKKVYDVIELVGLKGNEHKVPSDLSGGMQQRVALARAIVVQPKVLLLDEPLSALDAKVRKQMQEELKRLHKELNITFILVTHDQEEALVLSDWVVVMSKGKIEQEGTPSQVYDSPKNEWVSNFIGKANLFDGIYAAPGVVNVSNKKFLTDVTSGFAINEKVKVMVRPEDFDVVPIGKGIIDVFVESVLYKGQFWELKCQFENRNIYVESIDQVKTGQTIGVKWDQIDLHVMKVSQ